MYVNRSCIHKRPHWIHEMKRQNGFIVSGCFSYPIPWVHFKPEIYPGASMVNGATLILRAIQNTTTMPKITQGV